MYRDKFKLNSCKVFFFSNFITHFKIKLQNKLFARVQFIFIILYKGVYTSSNIYYKV